MPRVSLLIIDAARAYAQIVGFIFSTYYAETLTLAGVAHDPASGLDLARRLRPQVALLDFHAPGLSLIPHLQHALGHQRIIVLSSDPSPGYRRMALDHGAAAFIAKSAINTCLLPAVRHLVARSPDAGGPLPLPSIPA